MTDLEPCHNVTDLDYIYMYYVSCRSLYQILPFLKAKYLDKSPSASHYSPILPQAGYLLESLDTAQSHRKTKQFAPVPLLCGEDAGLAGVPKS